MTFAQMEKYYAVVSLIDQYERMIGQIDGGIAAHRIDAIPGGGRSDPHRMEEQIAKKDRAMTKLAQLRNIRDANLPHVQRTIEEATRRSKPSLRLKRQLLLKMRYEHGRDWPEIAEILKIQHPEEIAYDLLER